MNFKKILGTLVLASVLWFSQTQQFTMNDAVLGLRTNLAVKNIRDFLSSMIANLIFKWLKTLISSQILRPTSQILWFLLYQVNQNLSADQN